MFHASQQVMSKPTLTNCFTMISRIHFLDSFTNGAEMIRVNASRYPELSTKLRKGVVHDVLRSVKENGRFIKLRKNGWQIVTDHSAIRKIENAMRYTVSGQSRRKNAGNEAYIATHSTVESSGVSTNARKTSQRNVAQKVSPIKKRCLTTRKDEDIAAIPLHEQSNRSSMSLQEIVRNAQKVIETVQSGSHDSNDEYGMESELMKNPSMMKDLHVRQKYMEYLCDRHLDDDTHNSQDPSRPQLIPDNSSQNSDCSSVKLEHSPTIESSSKHVDIDYLTMPIDVDESISNFLNSVDCVTISCPPANSISESDLLYEQRLSEYINHTLHNNSTMIDTISCPS